MTEFDTMNTEGSDASTSSWVPISTEDQGHDTPPPTACQANVDPSDEDPACIIGIACRLPGGIRTPSSLWHILATNKTTQGPVPAERFNISGYHDPDGSRAGAIDMEGGYFLQEDVRHFDSRFFGINNLEATYMDPQQRKLLEVTYECFENAGVGLDAVSGSNTAVFVGNFTSDHQTMQYRDPDYLHRYNATGLGPTILSNRISHVFNLHGPSFTLDTACSSSMYCLHQAVSALKAGECDAAVVAAANLILSPEQHILTQKAGLLSPTSTYHTFDVSADGYGRAEAVNCIYIKRLSAALRDGDAIRAVIRGTAVNANGRTAGIALPSSEWQERVIRKAYSSAGLAFEGTDYVECHGTGTAVGDPIEVAAIGRCFGASRERRDSGGGDGGPLMIGSIKTNVGHSEAASGLSSLIKVVLAFEHGVIPPTRGVKNLNPKLDLDEFNLKVVTAQEKWPRSLQRASINSFGYGGANGHVILESIQSYMPNYRAPTLARALDVNEDGFRGTVVLPVSAKSEWSLKERIKQIYHLAEEASGKTHLQHLQSLAYTMGQRASNLPLPLRGFLLATFNDHEVTSIQDERWTHTTKTNNGEIPFAFVFTGQGAQYANMAKELLLKNGLFRDRIREMDVILHSLPPGTAPEWTLEQTLLDPVESSRVHEVTRSQPLCTAIQIALVDVLRAWGVLPKAVVGHSSGEIAASYAAGLMDADVAITVAYLRGFAVEQLQRQPGAMLAVGLGPDDAQALIRRDRELTGLVCMACVNSPRSVTLSGSVEAVEKVKKTLLSRGTFVRVLQTDGRAYHSPMMREIGPGYEEMLHPVFNNQNPTPRCDGSGGDVVMYSSVGHNVDKLATLDPHHAHAAAALSKILTDAKYWRDNLEQPVQFCAALSNLVSSFDKNPVHIIEIGPHSALKGPIEQTRKEFGYDFLYSPTLVRDQDADRQLQTLAGTLFLEGHPLNWTHVNSPPLEQVPPAPLEQELEIPPYPWDYSAGPTYSESRVSVELRNRKYLRHELLGAQQIAGNGIDWSWRNILRLDEVPWMRDHRVEDRVLFPAAAYIALAMEAICQAHDLVTHRLEPGTTFEFRNINIRNALVVNEDDGSAELHTSLSRRKLSTATSSAVWHEFTVSSWTAGQTRVHCVGSVRLGLPAALAGKDEDEDFKCTVTINNEADEGYETWSNLEPWYAKLNQEGLSFGAQFRSLTNLRTDSRRRRCEAISTTKLVTSDGPRPRYAVHPITLDACIQAAIMGSTAGDLSALRVHLPVFIESCRIRTPDVSATGLVGPALDLQIQSRSRTTGFGSKQFDSTMRDRHGAPVMDMQNVRASLYTARATTRLPEHDETPVSMQRQPCLRVRWKPDLLRFHPAAQSQIQHYLHSFLETQPADLRDHGGAMATMYALVDLAGFKKPTMRVLEIGNDCECRSKLWTDCLRGETTYPRCRSWSRASLDGSGGDVVDMSDGPFDVVVIPKLSTAGAYFGGAPGAGQLSLESLLHSCGGVIMTRKAAGALDRMRDAGLSIIDAGNDVLLGIRLDPIRKGPSLQNVVILVRNGQIPPPVEILASRISAHLQQELDFTEAQIKMSPLDSDEIPEASVYISLVETHQEYLATMNQAEMDHLRHITNTARSLIWLTGAGMLDRDTQTDANLTLSSGLSRALMLEQPSLRFVVLDIGALDACVQDDDDDAAVRMTCSNVVRTMVELRDDGDDDKEFIQSGGLVHISRFVPDRAVNSLFRRRLQLEAPARVPLGEAGVARLTIRGVGQVDTLHFQQVSSMTEMQTWHVPAGFVDVEVKAVSLNAKDVYAVNGKVETQTGTAATEFSGVVRAVEEGVDRIKPGDRVAVAAPNHFGTVERVPAWTVHKMLPGEDFAVMASLQVVYGTALYALQERARLRAGESILVHAGAGALGIATITLAQNMGAVVFATVGHESKKAYLMNELGVPPSHIFNSRDFSFATHIRQATGGQGVDVIINSLAGDLMHDSWECMADFGRFVEVGKQELVDVGKLDMSVFLRNCTFTAFDLSHVYFRDGFHRDVWVGKVREVLRMYRAGEIRAPPVRVFDVAAMTQAYRHFSTRDRVGKVVISLENPGSLVPVVPCLYSTTLSPKKVYLMVGCLGGLGRSLSRWMVHRGARNFVFLGRSGTDKAAARDLISWLRAAGASADVVRGDVVEPTDVDAAMQTCKATGLPIGGVIQAAMGLHEALFHRMTPEGWHKCVQPKWAGSWNLHRALQKYHELEAVDALDFFLLTSSVSGTMGNATESNYNAANAFLDAFARWLRQRGSPAVSVGLGMISEVGYLHENPEIEAILLRGGIQPLTEQEFLQVVDLAMSGARGARNDDAHLLTGLELFGLRGLRARGYSADHLAMKDPRAALLADALTDDDDDADGKEAARAGTRAPTVFTASWAKGLPREAAAALASEVDATSLIEAVLSSSRKRLSNLILMPVDTIDPKKPLSSFGIDSMIAAEYRTWFWSAFRVDLPFLDLMSADKSLEDHARVVANMLGLKE